MSVGCPDFSTASRVVWLWYNCISPHEFSTFCMRTYLFTLSLELQPTPIGLGIWPGMCSVLATHRGINRS